MISPTTNKKRFELCFCTSLPPIWHNYFLYTYIKTVKGGLIIIEIITICFRFHALHTWILAAAGKRHKNPWEALMKLSHKTGCIFCIFPLILPLAIKAVLSPVGPFASEKYRGTFSKELLRNNVLQLKWIASLGLFDKRSVFMCTINVTYTKEKIQLYQIRIFQHWYNAAVQS